MNYRRIMMLKSFLILSHATLSSGFFARLPTKRVSVPLIGYESRVGVSSLSPSESTQAPPDTLDELFLSIDEDGSGFIDLDELKSSLVALGQPSSDEHIRSLLSDANVECADLRALRIDMPMFKSVVGAGNELDHLECKCLWKMLTWA